MIPAESFQIDTGIAEAKSLLLFKGHLQSRSIMVLDTVSIGVGKVRSCIASQGAQDHSPCFREFGTFVGAEMPLEGSTPMSTPQSRSFLQLNALPESREAGTQRGGNMFYLGFGVKLRFIFQRRNMLASDTTWISIGHL